MGISLSAGNWLTLAAVIAFGVFQVISSYISSRHLRRSRAEIVEPLDAVRDQVQNSHTNNLRDDIDEVRHAAHGIREDVGDLRGDLRGMRAEMRSIRDDISAERSARAELEHLVTILARKR